MQRHHYRASVTLAALALGGLLPALGAPPATAPPPVLRPGDLDPTFGTGGKVLTSFGVYASTDIASGVALQPDGRIVVAGLSNGNGNFDFGLARYGVDGSLDASFGTGGKVLTDFGGGYAQALAVAMALQPDGRIVAAGVTNDARSAQGPLSALARYNANGSLDTAFGTGGKAPFDFGSALVLQPDGRIVAAGGSNANGKWDFELARYNVNGSLDVGFGTAGKVLTDFGDAAMFAGVRAVAVQPDGQIVAAGGFTDANGSAYFALARYQGQ